MSRPSDSTSSARAFPARTPLSTRRVALALTLGFLTLTLSSPEMAAARSAVADAASLHRTDRIVVKFAEGTSVRMRSGRLQSLAPQVDLSGLDAFLAQHPEISVRRHFERPELDLDLAQLDGEASSGWDLADLNLYYQFRLTGSRDDAALQALVAAVARLPHVERAFLEPIAAPATISTAPGRVSTANGPVPPTPDYTTLQGYLKASPSGINAEAVWGFAGGRGSGVKLIDVEGAWLWTHEDLPTPFFQGGTQINDQSWRNHGTAVMGEMVGKNNGFGVTGIASDMQVGCVSIGDMSVASALDMAAANVARGDLFLIELHAPGPNSNGSGQFGYVPMEWWQDNFDAIQTAVANGRICIEAGGNGEQDLDDPVYLSLFDRNVRDSGAIMVGAGTPTGLVAEWFTNYGSRIDLNGWGSSVTTAGYGTLQGGSETQWYTSGFGGTSSASPIISGAVASLQGMSKAQWNITLNATLARQILNQTGTPYVGSKEIGPRPNLVAARNLLLQGVGAITGLVSDANSHLPISGAKVRIIETGAVASTGIDGRYTVPVMTGTLNLEVTEFFHQTGNGAVTVAAGQTVTRNFDLNLKPAGSLSGTITAVGGSTISGARIFVLDTPMGPGTSGGGGVYTIANIPAANDYTAVCGLSPARGAVAREFDIVASNTTTLNIELPDAQTFEASNGSYTSQTPWAWGTPTSGPNAAYSGTKLWATNLSGNYGDNQSATLTSPTFDFGSASTLYLSLTQWYDFEAGFDGGQVQVKQGANWVTVAPVGGYPFLFLDGLGGDSGFSGPSGGWQPAVFDLTPFISNAVQFRLRIGSDGGVNGPGWYVDDVALYTGPNPSAVGEPLAGTLGARLQMLGPNPTSNVVSFSIEAAKPLSAQVRVVDASGRALRTIVLGELAVGSHRAEWDGRDEQGRDAGSGLFFLRLETPAGPADVTKLLRVR